ncbi:hypothetical protein OESDEN_20777 [Oesophagostomum dentatum]|uniref:CTLH domain-containing protein n=1 Tax=Oesophagostomum dentatum TaxID=61180 RepID=A0A0B1S6Q5_OESDE|nr:hypothetical protein OESDEN_20777 [Oesophagostomum dentatum]
MACEGYSKSMASFCNAAKLVPEEGEQSIETRKEIVALVLSRRSAEAIARMEDAYPDIFVLNKNIALVLKCQQFVEMAAEIAQQPYTNFQQTLINGLTDIEAPPARRTPPFGDESAPVQETPMEQEPCSSSTVVTSARNGQTAEDVKNGASGSADGGSIDDGVILAAADGDTTIIEEENTEDEEDAEVEDGIRRAEEAAACAVEYQKYNDVIEFGRSIYALSLQIPNLSGATKALLNDSLATICLMDYSQFESHHLLSEEHLSNLAKQTAAAILEFGGRSPQSQLTRYFHLWAKMQSELGSAKIPHCAFTDVTQLVFGASAPPAPQQTSYSSPAETPAEDTNMIVG